MHNAQGATTPMDVHVKLDLAKNRGEREVDPLEYQAIVGSLMYTALATRPDISYTSATAKATLASPATQTQTGRTTLQTANLREDMSSSSTTALSYGNRENKT